AAIPAKGRGSRSVGAETRGRGPCAVQRVAGRNGAVQDAPRTLRLAKPQGAIRLGSVVLEIRGPELQRPKNFLKRGGHRGRDRLFDLARDPRAFQTLPRDVVP